jgi:hypothetical protein
MRSRAVVAHELELYEDKNGDLTGEVSLAKSPPKILSLRRAFLR